MAFIFLAICFAALTIAFLSSLGEAVLLSLNPLRLKAQKRRGLKDAAAWLHLKNHIEQPIAAILIVSTLATVGLATVVGGIFTRLYGSDWLWAFSSGCTLVILFGAEILPKLIGVNHSEKIAPFILPILQLLLKVFKPIILIAEHFCALFTTHDKNAAATEERSSHVMDLITLAQVAKSENLIHHYEEIIIIHAATLSARRVSSIMVPREAIRFFRDDRSLSENLDLGCETLFTRYPVSRSEAVDDIYGYINVKEIACRARAGEQSIGQFVKPPLIVSPNLNLTQLLALFFREQEKFALVQGLSGGIAGIVTRHEIVQLIIGNKL